jgi:hypothetical protein
VIRSALLEEGRGRFTDSVEAISGKLQRVQYRIEYGDETARARVSIIEGGLVRLIRVIGTAEQVAAAEAEMILLSFRLRGDQVARKSPEAPSTGGMIAPAQKSASPLQIDEPTIIADGRQPVFKDIARNCGFLIGLEIGEYWHYDPSNYAYIKK